MRPRVRAKGHGEGMAITCGYPACGHRVSGQSGPAVRLALMDHHRHVHEAHVDVTYVEEAGQPRPMWPESVTP